MIWVAVIIYCIVSIFAFMYIRKRNKENSLESFDKYTVLVLILIAPLAIALLPIWLPYTMVKQRKIKKQTKVWRDEHNHRMKEYKSRTIIGGAEGIGIGTESLIIYKCKKCGYSLRSAPEGFFKISNSVYYNFKCKKCKTIVSLCSKDISEMSYVLYCPKCEDSHCLTFWNPIEGRCPKCHGMMEEQLNVSAGNVV